MRSTSAAQSLAARSRLRRLSVRRYAPENLIRIAVKSDRDRRGATGNVARFPVCRPSVPRQRRRAVGGEGGRSTNGAPRPRRQSRDAVTDGGGPGGTGRRNLCSWARGVAVECSGTNGARLMCADVAVHSCSVESAPRVVLRRYTEWASCSRGVPTRRITDGFEQLGRRAERRASVE